jgi:hypothetical protein
MNIQDNCHRFFCADPELVRAYRSDCVSSGIEGQQRVGFASASQTPPKNKYKFPTGVVSRPKFYTKVQPPGFICGVNLKSKI